MLTLDKKSHLHNILEKFVLYDTILLRSCLVKIILGVYFFRGANFYEE